MIKKLNFGRGHAGLARLRLSLDGPCPENPGHRLSVVSVLSAVCDQVSQVDPVHEVE